MRLDAHSNRVTPFVGTRHECAQCGAAFTITDPEDVLEVLSNDLGMYCWAYVRCPACTHRVQVTTFVRWIGQTHICRPLAARPAPTPSHATWPGATASGRSLRIVPDDDRTARRHPPTSQGRRIREPWHAGWIIAVVLVAAVVTSAEPDRMLVIVGLLIACGVIGALVGGTAMWFRNEDAAGRPYWHPDYTRRSE